VVETGRGEPGDMDPPPDTVLAGDVFYERGLGDAAAALLERAHRRGATVLIGDPGRTYLPRERLRVLAEYRVETTRELEDSDIRLTRVLAFRDAPAPPNDA